MTGTKKQEPSYPAQTSFQYIHRQTRLDRTSRRNIETLFGSFEPRTASLWLQQGLSLSTVTLPTRLCPTVHPQHQSCAGSAKKHPTSTPENRLHGSKITTYSSTRSFWPRQKIFSVSQRYYFQLPTVTFSPAVARWSTRNTRALQNGPKTPNGYTRKKPLSMEIRMV